MRISGLLLCATCLGLAVVGCGGDEAATVSGQGARAGGDDGPAPDANHTPGEFPAQAAAANPPAEADSQGTTPPVTNPFPFDGPPAELKDGEPPPLLGEISCSPANDFAISADGRFVARAGGFSTDMPLWRIADGRVAKRLTSHGSHLTSVAFSLDGKYLFAAHESADEANIARWNLSTGELVATKMGHPGVTWHLAVLPDGKTLASYGGKNDTTIRLWDMASEARLAEFEVGGPKQGWFSVAGDGSLLAAPAADGHVALIDPEDKTLVHKLKIGRLRPRGVDLVGGTLAVAGGFNEELVIGHPREDGVVHRVAIGKYVRHARLSADGQLVAVTSEDFLDNSVRVFSAGSGEQLFQFPPDDDDQVDQIRFHPAAPVLLTATGRKIKSWDLRGLTAD